MDDNSIPIIADCGDYILVGTPPHQVCSFGVRGCRICLVVLRRTKMKCTADVPVLEMHNPGGVQHHLPEHLLEEPYLQHDGIVYEQPFYDANYISGDGIEWLEESVYAIIDAAERKQQAEQQYNALIDMLRADYETHIAPQAVQQRADQTPHGEFSMDVLQLEIATQYVR